RCCVFPACARQWLLKATARHADWLQHQPAHDLRKRLLQPILQQLLEDAVASRGVPRLQAGNGIDPYRRRIARTLTVQDLMERWELIVDLVPRKAVYRRSCRVAEQTAQRDGWLPAISIDRNLPGLEVAIHIHVEIQVARLH